MKLFDLHEAPLEYHAFGEWIKGKAQRRIMKGDSKLKALLTGSGFTLDHVRFAIKNGECLRNPDPGSKALGPTYLEQTISNVLRDLAQAKQIPLGKFNDARVYFGLERLSVKKLKTEVDRREDAP
ncbi:MAG: hypothetical protein ACXAEN_16675 [Candidatus Thorarchaeota archaeon]|jgi:hypothetical protein